MIPPVVARLLFGALVLLATPAHARATERAGATGHAAAPDASPESARIVSDETLRLRALEKRLLARPTVPQALAGALELTRLVHDVAGPEGAATVQRIAAAWRTQPGLMYSPAAQVLAGLVASITTQPLDLPNNHVLRTWRWLGPFGDEHGSTLARHDAVEAALVGDPLGDGPVKAAGRQGEVRWQPLPPGQFNAAVRQPLGELVDRPDDATVYLSIWLRPRVHQAVRATLRLGLDGGARVWLAGTELPQVPAKPAIDGLDPEVPPLPAVDLLPVSLGGGWQRLVIKLAPAQASLALLAEVVDERGAPLPVETTATRPDTDVQDPVATAQSQQADDAVAGLRWRAGDKLTADLAAALLTMAWHGWPMPDALDERLLNLTVEELPATTQIALAHAMLPGETGDRIDRLLQWRQRLPHDVALLTATASALDRAGKTADAVRLWSQWSAEDGRAPEAHSVEACRVRVRLWTRMSADQASATLLRQCLQRWPQVTSLQGDWARHLAALDLWPQALEVLGAVAQREPNADYVAEAAGAALAALNLPEARNWLTRLHDLAPWRTRGVEALARAELESQQVQAARRTLQQVPAALRRTQWFELAGRVAAEQGHRVEAEAHFRTALGLSPARADLRARLQSVSHAGTFYASQRRDLLALAKRERGERRTVAQEHRLRQTVIQALGNGQLAKYEGEVTYFGPGAHGPYQAIIEYPPSLSQAEVVQAVVVRADGRIDRQVHQEVDRYTQDDSGMYFDLERITLTFKDMHPGDTVIVEHEVRDLAPTPFGLVFGELLQLADATAVRESDVTVLLPEGRDLFWTLHDPNRGHQGDDQPRQRTAVLAGEGGPWHEWRWRTGPYPAVAQEENGPAPTELYAYLHVSSFASWAAAARWYAGLMAEALPTRGQDPVIRELAQRLAQGKTTTEAKVRAVYDYVRTQVRYVGLEFGIHSIKPHGAREVAQRQFGDCKDKATLIVALLAELEVDAELALVRTRDEGPLLDGQASLGVFNHAIAYVPALGWWLDATATWHGPRELPLGDAGGTALRIRPGPTARQNPAPVGVAALERLPEPDERQERDRLDVDVQLRDGGAATVRWSLTQHGLAAADLRAQLGAASSRKERLESDLAARWPGAVLTDVAVTGIDPLADDVTVALRGEVPRLGTLRQGEWQWAPLRPGRSLADRLTGTQTRTTPLDLQRPLRIEQQLTVQLPPRWQATRWPAAVRLTSPWGQLDVASAVHDGVWQGRATLTLAAGRILPEQYGALRAWLVQVDTALRAELVLTAAKTATSAPALRTVQVQLGCGDGRPTGQRQPGAEGR